MQRMSNQFVWSCILQSDSLIQHRALLCMQYSFARGAILIEKIIPLTAGCPVEFFEKVVAYIPACKIFLQKGPHSSEKVFHDFETLCTAFL